METKFKIDFSRIADRLLLIHLRAGVLKEFVDEAFSVLKTTIWASFSTSRHDDYFELNHNGQVCYLRAALNAKFKSVLGIYFEIEDQRGIRDIAFATTEKQVADHVFASVEPAPADGLYAVSEADVGNLTDFVVRVPSDLYGAQLDAIKHFVDKYKLPTMQPQYEPKYS